MLRFHPSEPVLYCSANLSERPVRKGGLSLVRTIEAVQTILPVLLALSIGVLCRRKRLISRGGVDALKTVAVNIGLPAVLISIFAAAD